MEEKPTHFSGHPLTTVWEDIECRIDVLDDVPGILFWYPGRRMGPGTIMTAEWAEQLRDGLTTAIEQIRAREDAAS